MKTATEVLTEGGALDDLERNVRSALETYSNVHRGSGQNSAATTHLFEAARRTAIEHAGRSTDTHEAVFCPPRTAEKFLATLPPSADCRVLSSAELGLPLGVRAVVLDRASLSRCEPVHVGGGTARLVAYDWVIWAQSPERFEAGTPPVVNAIAFAQALRLAKRFGAEAFRDASAAQLSGGEGVCDDGLSDLSGRELLGALQGTLIGRDVRVPTLSGPRRYTNLDNGASTPTFEPVWEAACRAWRQGPEARQHAVDEVRSTVARFVGAPLGEYDVLFTGNTTEAINLVAESIRREAESGGAGGVVNSLLEHNSNELPWRASSSMRLDRLGIDDHGFVDLEELDALLSERNRPGAAPQERVAIVTVSGASNVLGVYNDLTAISEIVHRHGARLLVDGAQLVAHRRIDMLASNIDYLAFSAHKAYAPFGTGVLAARRGLLGFDAAEIAGIRAAGEENVFGIAALGKALELLSRIGLDVIQEEEQALTRRALAGLAQVPGVKLYGITDPGSAAFARKGGVIPFNVRDLLSHRVASELAARAGIGVRSGCHCAHLTVKRILRIPPAVQSLQGAIVSMFRSFELPGVVRVSVGIENTAEDIDTLCAVLTEIARGPRLSRAEKSEGKRQTDGLLAKIDARVWCTE